MAWILLVLAGLFEVVWAIGLKYAEGFTKLWPSVITIAAIVASGVMLSMAAKKIPIGTAYAIWTGIGAVGTAVLGMILFNESKDVTRIACLALIVAGIVGLKVFTPE